MFYRCIYKNLSRLCCLLLLTGCGHRSGKVPVAIAKVPPSNPLNLMVSGSTFRTYQSSPAAVQFDYPADWIPDQAQTACFAIKASNPAYSSLSLDIPKLPWHLPGMITCNMVASGYISDLKKNQIHDAVVNEKVPVKVCGCEGQRITCRGHENGKPSIDIAVILVHASNVYVISADSDEPGYDTAKKTLDAAVASWKWTK